MNLHHAAWALLGGLALAMAAGCGGGASEDKPLADVQAEAPKMNADQLQAAIESYKAAVEKRQTEIKGLAEDLQKVPLTEMMGEKAKAIHAKMDEANKSVLKLQERMQVYANELVKRCEALKPKTE